jgi:hypothetical protein
LLSTVDDQKLASELGAVVALPGEGALGPALDNSPLYMSFASALT